MNIKSNQLEVYEKRLMLIGIPVFLCAYFMGTQLYSESTETILKNLGRMLLLALVQWRLVWYFNVRFRKRYPQYHQMLRRVLFTIAVSSLTGLVLNFLIFNVTDALAGKYQLSLMIFLGNFGPMVMFSAMITGAHEVLYNFHELRRIEREKEELQKAHLQSQLDGLKSQVNPHFLFNSLNTLLSIITASPKQAEQFVVELSAVYRYLLQVNENQLSTLEQELQFIRSYFHLLKTRFGTAIQLEIEVAEAARSAKLPSLTLQLLLENAVKHNVIATTQPLHIRIYTAPSLNKPYTNLVVQNNLQPKAQRAPSNRMGLNNIMSKFQLLNAGDVLVTAQDHLFTVTLPLLY